MRLTALTKRAIGKIGGPVVARGTSLPAPVEGWDAVSPIAAMNPKRAVRLDNWFPQASWIEPRRGFIIHSDTETDSPVETLMAYQGVSSNNLFGVSDDTIFDVTSPGDGIASVTGLANARFQHINFTTTGGHFLICVNGADGVRYFNGTVWATASITGITASNIIGINAHKNRIWYVQINSTKAAYLPVDSIQGAVVTFELGGLFTQGGYLMAMGTWSVDAGDGPDDYAVFFSSRGQVAIYKGSDPSDPLDWFLVGVFYMGAPIGRRCLTKVGADIAIISIDGVIPLSKAMIFERAAVTKVSLTERIQRVMNESARSYGDNFGWQLMSYPKGTRAILNVPVTENETQYQYVMNTLTGAWCRFLGMNANCWELYNDAPFFGGNDGVVYEADRSGTDHNTILTADMITAFSYFGSPGRQKRWTMIQPLITTDQQVEAGLAFNTDFRTDAPISIPTFAPSMSALWDDAEWDDANWAGDVTTKADWTSITGLGQCGSIRMVVEVHHPNEGEAGIWRESQWGLGRWGYDLDGPVVTLQVNGFNLTHEMGAFV